MKSNYLSWSQLNALEKGTYIDAYIHGKKFENEAMRFGKRFAEAIEMGIETGDPLIDYGVLFLPRYQHHEYKIEVDGLLGYFDGFNEPNLIGEFKTGKTGWTEKKVKKGQLLFYALMVFKKFGVIPKAELHHINNDKEIHTVRVKFTKKELQEMEKRIKKALLLKNEIHGLYE